MDTNKDLIWLFDSRNQESDSVVQSANALGAELDFSISALDDVGGGELELF